MSLTSNKSKQELLTIAGVLAGACMADGNATNEESAIFVQFLNKSGISPKEFQDYYENNPSLSLPEKKDDKIALMKEVVKIVCADKQVTKEEMGYVASLAGNLGLTKEEVANLFESHISSVAFGVYVFAIVLFIGAAVCDIFNLLPDGYGWLTWVGYILGVILSWAASAFNKDVSLKA